MIMDFLKNTVFSMKQVTPQVHIFSWYHALLFFSVFAIFHIVIHNQEVTLYRDRIAKASTILMLVLQFILYGWYIVSPESLFLKGLPLYTCRIVLFLFVAGQFFNKEKCLKLASYWGVYGGIAGLIFPTVFKYPFPHILQISTVVLHIYIFLVGSYYLFVKKIGMNLEETKWCCKITTMLLIFNTIFNSIFGSNYTSTIKMPAHLINYLGLNLPNFLCLPAVIIGYVIVTYFQYYIVNKCTVYYKNKERRSVDIK